MKKLVLIFILTLCAAVVAQDLPRVAVYVTGGASGDERKALGAQLLSTLVSGGRYGGIARQGAFTAELDSARESMGGGSVDDDRITEAGKRFGAAFVCAADLTAVFGEFQISARVIDVETNDVAFIGVASGELKTMRDLEQLSDKVVTAMFGGQAVHKDSSGEGSKEDAQKSEPTAEPKLDTREKVDLGASQSVSQPSAKDSAKSVVNDDDGNPKVEMRLVEYKTPILGDIPVIGKLFRKKRYEPIGGSSDPETFKGEITAEVLSDSGIVKFYRQGGTFEPTQLKISDMTGYVVQEIDIADKRQANGNGESRMIGVWDMRNLKGQKVRKGTYYVKSSVRTLDGKREKVSLTIGVR